VSVKRKQHSAEFKARVAMAALSGEKTLAEQGAGGRRCAEGDRRSAPQDRSAAGRSSSKSSIALSLTEAALDSLLTDQRSRVRAQRHCVAVIMVLAVLRDRGVGFARLDFAMLTERSRRRKVVPMVGGAHRKPAAPTPEDCDARERVRGAVVRREPGRGGWRRVPGARGTRRRRGAGAFLATVRDQRGASAGPTAGARYAARLGGGLPVSA
jgi:hypothetical protein